MKKIVIILSFIMLAFVGFSQTSNDFVAFANDTTTDSETVNMVVTAHRALNKNYAVTLNLIPANSSGTATVTAMPQGSSDNTVWFDLESAVTTVNNAGTIATTKWEYPNAYWTYYRYELVSTGTGVTHFTGEIGLKKKN
jgi:hypothetical protein